MKAIWNGQVIAESDYTLVVENNHYFPENSIKKIFSLKVKHILFVHGKEQQVIFP